MTERRAILSGSTFEEQIGYARAVVDGDWVHVSGTTGFDYSTMTISDDVVEQAEQCVRNIVIRRSYRPLSEAPAATLDDFFTSFHEGRLTADELLTRYAAQVYGITGSYEEAARRMGLDRRTVKAKVETYLKAGQLSN